MIDLGGVGAYGIVPFLSEDLLKQAKLANIKTKAGKVAYLTSLGDKAKKPVVRDGIDEARGALKWISSILESLDGARDEEEKNEK
jgi:hypothetical protein